MKTLTDNALQNDPSDDLPNSSSNGRYERVSEAAPAWYTPARLLVAFCIVETLVFLDRGVIASNGVNGDIESKSGIQVRALSLSIINHTN